MDLREKMLAFIKEISGIEDVAAFTLLAINTKQDLITVFSGNTFAEIGLVEVAKKTLVDKIKMQESKPLASKAPE